MSKGFSKSTYKCVSSKKGRKAGIAAALHAGGGKKRKK